MACLCAICGCVVLVVALALFVLLEEENAERHKEWLPRQDIYMRTEQVLSQPKHRDWIASCPPMTVLVDRFNADSHDANKRNMPNPISKSRQYLIVRTQCPELSTPLAFERHNSGVRD